MLKKNTYYNNIQNKSTKNKIVDEEEFNKFIKNVNNINLNDDKNKNLNIFATKIQKTYRGYIYRLKHLPLILYIFQNYLKSQSVKLINETKDGRINSVLDENEIINFRVWNICLHDYLQTPGPLAWYCVCSCG